MFTRIKHVGQRLKASMSNPIVRRNVSIYMGGKIIGLLVVLFLISAILPHASVHAQDGTDAAMAPINTINTAWTLIAAFLVFGMQVGFVMLEAGFARSRESINILVEGIASWQVWWRSLPPATGLIR